MTVFTGTLPDWQVEPVLAADLDAMTDALDALNDAWTAFTPAWSSSGTQPAIGNGTKEGKYLQVGKFAAFEINLTAGSTTTYGTGQYFLSIPFSARVQGLCLPCYMLDAGTANKAAIAYVSSTLNLLVMVQNTTDVGATTPHTMANGDRIHITGVLEVA